MVIIKISGGLGNQLFQYAFGKAVAKVLGTTFKVDFVLSTSSVNFTNRENGLKNFGLELECATNHEIAKTKLFKNGILSRVERKLAQKYPFLFKHLIVENSNYSIHSRILDNAYYDGYWQSEDYFKSIENDLRSQVILNKELDDDAQSVLGEINSTNSVSVHIRRGDYLNISINQSIFCECSLDYYERAINTIKQNHSDLRFFIFSDDVEWAKDNFIDKQFTVVDVNDRSAHVDFWLMMNCKHQIIANSSYSWWAAWLNKNVDKTVISPKNWFKDSTQNEKSLKILIPQNWLSI